MKKLIATIISSFIPFKAPRRKVRKILMYYGLIKYVKTLTKAKREEPKLKFKYNLAVLAIAKNEGSYFKEWIEYHRLVGVDKFYIFDNESDDDTRQVLAPYIKSGLVEYILRPGQKQQRPAYKECVEANKYEAKWMTCIDLDEFLVPARGGDTLVEYLDGLPRGVSQIEVGWVMYGSNGHLERPQGMVIENYKSRSCESRLDRGDRSVHYKSIFNPRFVMATKLHGHSMLTGAELSEWRKLPIDEWSLRCHHYHCKSWEEYKSKAPRGCADWGATAGAARYSKSHFDAHDHNDILDPIMDKFIPSLKKKLS